MDAIGYRTAHVRDLTRADGWAPIRRSLGIRSFGANGWTAAKAGEELILEHVELSHEELYIVIEGHATFTVDGEVIDAPAGSLVLVSDPGIVRSAVSSAPNTVVLTIGAEPGAAFEPNAWETNREVIPLFEQQRYTEGKQLLLAALEDYADPSYLLYNLACADAHLGEADEALEYLRRAIDIRPELGPLAAEDEDLITLRRDPRFVLLTG
jgi:tetratricopeptide (TPR) repeat protein